MDEVIVNREALLKKLIENRDAHQKVYKDALDGFFVETEKRLIKAIKKIENKQIISSISISAPVDHTEQYEEAIAMLEMSVEEEITLRKHEFNNYVLDSWISTSEKNLLRTYALSSANAGLYQ